MTTANSDTKHIWDTAGKLIAEVEQLRGFVNLAGHDENLTERERNAFEQCERDLRDASQKLDDASMAIKEV